MMQRGFAPIIILVAILVIIAVAGGAYYVGKSQSIKPETTSSSNAVVTSQTPQPTTISQTTPTPSPSFITETTNTKAYTNSKYNFEFKYPDSFTLLDQSEDYIPPYALDTPIIIAKKVGFTDKPHYMQDVNFSVSKSSDLSKCYLDEHDQKITERQTINGTEYYVTLAGGVGAGNSIAGKRYRVIKDNICFEIALVNEIGNGGVELSDALVKKASQDMQELEKELDQILTTFKFGDQNTSAQTCQTDKDCLNGSSCRIVGLMVKDAPMKKRCIAPGARVPL